MARLTENTYNKPQGAQTICLCLKPFKIIIVNVWDLTSVSCYRDVSLNICMQPRSQGPLSSSLEKTNVK